VAELTCAFCAHPFTAERKRVFCHSCLPPAGEWSGKVEYQRRYNLLYRAAGMTYVGGWPSCRLPSDHPARVSVRTRTSGAVRFDCAECGRSVEYVYSGGTPRRFCSSGCGKRHHDRASRQRRAVVRTERTVACLQCGDLFCTVHPTKKFCSQRCATRMHKRQRSDRPAPSSRGVCRSCGAVAEHFVCDSCQQVKLREARRRWKARKRGAAQAEPYTLAQVAERDGWVCQLCRGEHGKVRRKRRWNSDPQGASIDHVVPLSKGGDDTLANVQLAHFGCNTLKRNGVWGAGEQLRLVG
jgi:hypothetical protein